MSDNIDRLEAEAAFRAAAADLVDTLIVIDEALLKISPHFSTFGEQLTTRLITATERYQAHCALEGVSVSDRPLEHCALVQPPADVLPTYRINRLQQLVVALSNYPLPDEVVR